MSESKRLTVREVLDQLTEICDQYPEFYDSELEVTDEFGEQFHVTATDVANGPWLVIEEEIDKTESEANQLRELDRMGEALEDFRDHGIRADTTPTMTGRSGTELVQWFYDYLAGIDKTVRARATRALEPVEAEEADDE